MFVSSTLEASVLMGKNYSDNLHSIKNRWKHLILKQMFEISEKLILEQSDEIFGVSQISWENSPLKLLSLVNDESLACKGLCILRFCVMSWKGESEPNIKHCLGTAVGLVQRFIQNFPHIWRRTDRIRVEYLPRIHYITARRQSPRVLFENEHRARRIERTDHLHVDV